MTEFAAGFALLVGVGRYKEELLSVPVTALDAKNLGGILTDPQFCGYPKSQVTVLTNEDANKERILDELDVVKKKAEENENATVVIFLSGHGWQEDGYHFLPHETQTFYKSGKLRVKLDTALANKDFLEKVRTIPSQRLILLFNTCFAGGAGTALSPEIEEMAQLAPVPLGLYDQLLQGSGRVIVSSSQAGEKSWIKSGASNSLFVTHLLHALRGQGIETKEKTVNILDVFKYLSKAVPSDAQTIGVVQTPVLKAYDVTQDLPIALLLGGKGLSPNPSQPIVVNTKPHQWDIEQKRRFVLALLRCGAMADRDTRGAIVNELPSSVRDLISRSNVDRVDVMNIVNRCLDYAGGVAELVEAVRFFEGDSQAMQQIDDFLSVAAES